jgi:hypothetical protein
MPSLLFVDKHRYSVHGFANYLLSRSNCMTELSTDEVIMNYPVKSHTETDDADMKIVLVEPETTTTTKNAAVVISNVHPIVTLQHPASQQSASVASPITVQLQVVTTNPNTDKDYQFAMDIILPEEEGPENKNPTIPASAVQFRKGGCDHKHRITGRRNDILTLEFLPEQIPTSSSSSTFGIRVVAGWAAGHEAVRLTVPLEFRFVSEASKEDNVEKIDPHQDEKSEQEHDNKELSGKSEVRKGQREQPEGILSDPQKVLDGKVQFQMHGIQQQLFDKRKGKLLNNKHNEQPPQKAERLLEQQYQKMERLVIHKDQSTDDGDSETRSTSEHHANKRKKKTDLRDFRIGFESTTDEFATFTFSSYLQGALFLIVTPVVLVYGLLSIRRNALYTKGRLAL